MSRLNFDFRAANRPRAYDPRRALVQSQPEPRVWPYVLAFASVFACVYELAPLLAGWVQ